MHLHWWSEWHGQELFMQRQLAKSVAKLNIQLQGIVIFVRINICHGEPHVQTGGQRVDGQMRLWQVQLAKSAALSHKQLQAIVKFVRIDISQASNR